MNLIKKLREEENMTQDDLADELEVDRRTISDWEIGKHMPYPSSRQKICEYFEIDPERLYSNLQKNLRDGEEAADDE